MAFKTIEEANEAYLVQHTELAAATAAAAAAASANEAAELRIKELQEFNQKLFLRITEPAAAAATETPEMNIEEFANTIKL